MNIGQLARATGVPIDTIRYYEREQVLPPARRRPNGYRDYAAADAQRLRFIRRARELGFALEEIRGLLEACPGHGALSECPIMSALTGEPA